MPPRELLPEEFTDRLRPIFEHVRAEESLAFSPAQFFLTWPAYMRLGIARTWETHGAVLGALFTRDLFADYPTALVVFWFALPEVRHTPATRELFQTFERAAKLAGCYDIQSSSQVDLEPERREAGYLKHGFTKAETVFQKIL